ncbi:MAG: thioredoxin-disulfide reductase [Desulfobacterales bacterium]|nr:thioredoxin-disulfide reductase [Desulfobacterales bacterium]
MESIDYDLVIIGGGPAGLTAGLYASRARLKTLLLEKLSVGGQIIVTDWIENYPGFPEGISGFDLAEKMMEQAKKFGLEIEYNEVLSLNLNETKKNIFLRDKTISARAIIIATGASPRKLNIPGEDDFYGKGVSFCATCDGPFYKNRVAVAVGGGDTAVQESIFLTRFAKKVYLIHRRDQFRATKILQERALANDKIEFVFNSVVTKINGNDLVEGVSVKNVKSGEISNISADGCFIWVGIKPNTELLKGSSINLDDSGFIITDSMMQASVKGIFAAGDIRNTPLRQVSTAIGDGAISAHSAFNYIENLE